MHTVVYGFKNYYEVKRHYRKMVHFLGEHFKSLFVEFIKLDKDFINSI